MNRITQIVLFFISALFQADGEKKAITIDWEEVHAYRHKMDYEKGKLRVKEPGFYYVYAKTCFRYYALTPRDSSSGQLGTPAVDVSNTQLIQYVYHEISNQNSKPSLLMKAGSTMRWNNMSYNMYCAHQGRGVRLEGGDALFVNVSNAWMLDREGEGTYFGAIKLGNWKSNTQGADMLLNFLYAKEPLIYDVKLSKCFFFIFMFYHTRY